MQIPFNELKATQAAAYLLKLRGAPMSYMKLIKLLYLADRTALQQWGRSITTDRYVSMDRGPVLSRVLDLASEGEDPHLRTAWARHIESAGNYEVQLVKDPGLDELSEAETHLLDSVFKEHGAKGRWDLVDLTHQLPEWQDPHGSAIPIAVKDILKAGGKTEIEVATIEDELEQLAVASGLFFPRQVC